MKGRVLAHDPRKAKAKPRKKQASPSDVKNAGSTSLTDAMKRRKKRLQDAAGKLGKKAKKPIKPTRHGGAPKPKIKRKPKAVQRPTGPKKRTKKPVKPTRHGGAPNKPYSKEMQDRYAAVGKQQPKPKPKAPRKPIKPTRHGGAPTFAPTRPAPRRPRRSPGRYGL